MPANDTIIPRAPTALRSVEPKPSPDAKAARRNALQWIAEAFNVDKGTYSPDVSDKTIALETGLSESAVAELREEFYGPVKLPSELEAVQRELADIETARVAMGAQVHKDLQALAQRTEAASARVTALIRANGWK